ncbi:hypothetical protein GPECTOR_8g209 [Gonium pectorale]|uniref:PUM-HD domain-containing protein n=1 Tax=Gonium pectorale TaxID=33097 RepID=A0A150GSJ6_GONPE|nr:hypothetical protein GPECTOR_8g209 [Gonium pectorale]|eukprot:KXZ52825.1 hypothetical protein GPECTOR_8g209 [Gonium pectorale]
MAKPSKAAPPAKASKPQSKPPAKPGSKRKGDGAAAAPPAKRPRPADGKGKGAEPGKQLSSKEKRNIIKEKKLLHKKNWDVIQDVVQAWEKLRPKETPDAERKQLVVTIMKKITGKLLELSNHHTASRVIQFCVRYGNDTDRRVVMEEVRANIIELSKSKYGHFLVRKLINTAKKEDVPGIVRLFRGHVAQLLRQPYGADVITDVYDVASTADRNALCAEFYGKEFVLFDGISGEASRLHSLKQLIAGVPPAKQRAIIQHMTKALTPIMEKAILHPPITHRLVKDYLECSTGLSVEEAVETLAQTGEAVLRMVHTHEGAAAACMVLGYGTPRDRKRLVRAMKGHVGAMAADEWGHAVLCMALGCVDDTSLTGKVLLPEIKEVLPQGVHQATGVRLLMQLLAPGCRRHFPPAIYELLHPPQRIVRGSSGKAVTDIDADEDDAVDFGGAAAGGDEDDDNDELFTAKGSSKGSGAGGKGKAADKAKPKAKGRQQAAEDDADGGGAGKGPEEGEGGEDGAAAVNGAERVLGASKKDPQLRRRELLGSGPKSLSAALTAVVAAEAPALLRSAHSCELVVEVARGGEQGLLFELDPAGVRSVHDALVADAARSQEEMAAAVGEADEDEEAGPGPAPADREHVLLSYFSSRALRRLLLAAAEEKGQGSGGGAAAAFATALWEGVLQGRCKQWLGSHAEKVLAALLHCGVEPVVAAASKELKPLVKQPLEEWASKFLSHGAKDGQQGGKGGRGVGGKAAGGKAEEEQKPGKAAGKAAAPAAKGRAKGAQETVPQESVAASNLAAGRPKRTAAAAAGKAGAKQAKR